jgi:hypothetical protein
MKAQNDKLKSTAMLKNIYINDVKIVTTNQLEQRFSNFFELGTTFISQNNSADHLTLVPFESKFIIY